MRIMGPCLSKSVAPNLDLYFKCLEKAGNDALGQMGGGDPMAAMGAALEMIGDPAKQKQMEAKQAAMQKELASHVRNSVQRHDVGKSGSPSSRFIRVAFLALARQACGMDETTTMNQDR